MVPTPRRIAGPTCTSLYRFRFTQQQPECLETRCKSSKARRLPMHLFGHAVKTFTNCNWRLTLLCMFGSRQGECFLVAGPLVPAAQNRWCWSERNAGAYLLLSVQLGPFPVALYFPADHIHLEIMSPKRLKTRLNPTGQLLWYLVPAFRQRSMV